MHGLSQRRACRLGGVDLKTVRRGPSSNNPEVRRRMREIAGERQRFGYRRIGLLLEREEIYMNHKKLRRMYKEEGLTVKRRHGRKRATGAREPLNAPRRPNDRWSMDFLSDVFEPAAGSAFSQSSKTARARASLSSPIPHSRAGASPASSTA